MGTTPCLPLPGMGRKGKKMLPCPLSPSSPISFPTREERKERAVLQGGSTPSSSSFSAVPPSLELGEGVGTIERNASFFLLSLYALSLCSIAPALSFLLPLQIFCRFSR